MSLSWMDELGDSNDLIEDEESFYCPYTNGPDCALLSMGWQPQELCDVLECEQLKLFRPGRGRREAA